MYYIVDSQTDIDEVSRAQTITLFWQGEIVFYAHMCYKSRQRNLKSKHDDKDRVYLS